MKRVATSRLTGLGVVSTPWVHRAGLLVALLLLTLPGRGRSSDLLSAGSIGQTRSNPAEADSQFEKAREAYKAHDFGQAKSLLKQVLQAEPQLVDAYLLLGLAEVESGEATAAIAHYQQALKLQPKSFAGHYYLALAYLRESNMELGRRELQQAVALNPKHSDAVYDLGVVLLGMGKPEEALTDLRRARELGPPRLDVAFNIIRAELEAQHPEEARREAAARNLPANPEWQAAVGKLFLEKREAQDAVPYLAEALRAQPSRDEVRRQLAVAQLQSHQP